MSRWVVGILLFLFVSQAEAQNRYVNADTIAEIEVTAEREKAANVYSTTPLQAITGSDIETLGMGSLADAMRRFAGSVVKDYGGIGGMKTVSVRNMGATHTAVSYDGITMSNTQAGQIDISCFTMENISMLQFSIGQGSDIMQSARHYASAGVIAIETEKPHFDFGRDYALKIRTEGGAWGEISPWLRYWQRLGRRTSLSVEGSYMRADGSYPFMLRNGTLTTEEKRYNSDIWQWHVEGNIHHEFADSGALSIKAYYYKSERGLPGVVILYNDDNNERLWDENWFVQATYKRPIAKGWRLVARAKYTHTWNKYEDYNVKYTDGVMRDLNTQQEWYVSATIGWDVSRWLQLSLAQDMSWNKLRTNINGSPNPLRFTSLTALAARAKWNRLTADANIVMTYATESLTESETYSTETPDDRKKLSPALSVGYRLLPREALYLRAMVKSTFRMPTFNDLYYLRIGNTGLSPEKAAEYGVGIAWSARPKGIMRYMTVTVDGYYNNVTDKIVAFPSTYVWKMTNFGKVDIFGLDATMGMGIDVARQVGLELSATFMWQDARDKSDPGSSTYDKQLPYTPKVSGSASAILRNKWLTIGYTIAGQGKRWSSAMATDEYKLNAYVTHDISASHLFRIGRGRSLTLRATVKNLFDKQYAIIRYYPMTGRQWGVAGTIEI